ncbi:IS1595 family transposase [Acidithiobacillus concretivorus]|uniref:IS1595 family transposase n=1 Tax=Acidithiobacillus concretivorus TaxID=3063952 RepID=A0ABS5ZPQ7_9PROT|nr:IS1595 family transposase [Acidithiobacillus concretivorus]MBU2738595.1 IS1595 family transposase [Acidithiobacillus concretivorus]
MAMNRVQFQKGLSLPDFLRRFGTEEQCATALESARWPDGFHCPQCDGIRHSVLKCGSRKTFQCSYCRHQTSLIAGTLFQGTRLPLTIWFLAIYLISQAKTGLSALALSRQLGVSYPTAWRIHHKLMQSMLEREALYTLQGSVQADDAYLGGERSGGKPGRGSENKVPFVAAVSVDAQEHPVYARFTTIKGFTGPAIADWARTTLDKACQVLTDGLPCFNGIADAGRGHAVIVSGGRKPRDLPQFSWVNTVLGNLKTSLSGAYHAFKFRKYAQRYLSTVTYRFNRRFNLAMLPMSLLRAAVNTGPRPEHWLRSAESSC